MLLEHIVQLKAQQLHQHVKIVAAVIIVQEEVLEINVLIHILKQLVLNLQRNNNVE